MITRKTQTHSLDFKVIKYIEKTAKRNGHTKSFVTNELLRKAIKQESK